MIRPAIVLGAALVVLMTLALSGCVPQGQTQTDEEKEPHFMAGKKRVITLDFAGAIDCFEKALEVNPHSGAAHFELACLYEDKEPDPAAAIYHYQSYLRLRPEAGNARVVKQRIDACKQELARDVSLGPLTDRQQKEFEKMAEEGKKQLAEIQRLTEELDKWKAYAAGLAGSNSAARLSPRPVVPVNGGSSQLRTGSLSRPMEPPTAATTTKTHIVKAGENATVIAKKYGLKVEVLLAANPRVDSRRLKIGQSLLIPSP